MSCESCAMGLPCDGGGQGESGFKPFGDPDKNRNTLDDLAVAAVAGLSNRQARRSGVTTADDDDGPMTVAIFGQDVKVSTLAIGGAAALGVGILLFR